MKKIKGVAKLNNRLIKLKEISEEVRGNMETKMVAFDKTSPEYQNSIHGVEWERYFYRLEMLLFNISVLEPFFPEEGMESPGKYEK